MKITDFGLSKAMSHSSVTEPGVVKGKFAYLAPEAAEGQDVDLRADVFAAGLCLWELLAGEKLFQGSDDLEVLEKVRAARIPALEGKHPDVTPELDGILARALSRAPDERFGSCQALGNELTNYLFSRQLKANSYDLGAMISYLFDQEGERPPWKERLDRLFDDEIALLDEVVEDGKEPWRSSQPIDISTWNLPASDGAPGEELWAQIDRLPPPTTPASADESRSSSLLDRLEGPRTRHELDETGSSGRGWLPWAIGAGLVALIGLGWFLSSGGS